MKLIIFLDDDNGMMFFGKRQSRDSAATACIEELTQGVKLYMGEYSEKLYGGLSNAVVSRDFLSLAGEDDFCLVEDIDPAQIDGITYIAIFRWHREYPADLYCTLDMSKYVECRRRKLNGTSHDRLEIIEYKLK